MGSTHQFADVFPQTSEAQWKKLVETALKGGAFEKLIGKSADGLAIQPLYAQSSGPRAFKSKPGAWNVLARVDQPDFEAANLQALSDLEGGANGLHLIFAGSPSAHGFGLPMPTKADLATLFKDIHLQHGIAIELDLSPETFDAGALIADYAAGLGIAPNLINISFGFNPLGAMARAGGGYDWADVAPHFVSAVNSARKGGLSGPFVVADGRLVHDAGGSEAQELAFTLANAIANIRALEQSGIALEEARGMIGFRMASDADEFFSLAKFRALRRLWARIEAVMGLAHQPIHIHAESAWRMITKRDPWVNLLRTSVAAFSAGLGGADSISLLPFTQAIGLPDAFARRLARNTQLILLEESNLDKVADPAAGAGGFETLTEELCLKAWAIFQQIEAQGGLYAALKAGKVQAEIAAVKAARDKNIGRRKEAITGVSEFPNIHEADVPVLAKAPAPKLLHTGTFPALVAHRSSEAFEALRDAAEAAPVRPTVFLANLGTVADFNARSMFAKNFYEAGGLEALGNDGFASADELIAAYKESGAKIACLCSSDAIYAAQAEATAKALASAGAHVAFAGRPGELEAGLKAAGVRQFIFAGCDVLETLKAAHVLGGL